MSVTDSFGEGDTEAIQLYGALLEISECFAFQREVAPTSGYNHYQGYLELVNKHVHTWVQNHLAKHNMHFEFLEGRKGTPMQAWAYATKEETRAEGPWTFGAPRDSEKANKSFLFVQAIKRGATDAELCDAFPGMMCNSFQNANRIRQAYNVVIRAPRRETPMEVYLFYGPSGTGKSQFARDQAEQAGYDPYVLPIGKDFWLTPAMCGKKYVIIDDFKSNLGLKDFLNLLDKYPVEAPTKGGFIWWYPDIVVVTTNRSPHDWYQYNTRDDEKNAVFRRFTGAYRFDKNDAGVPSPVEVNIFSQLDFVIRQIPDMFESVCATCDQTKNKCICRK